MTGYPDGEFLLPLFPLPNVVFFPRTRLPLHVFEPRYRKMVGDALEGDRRIGIVLLRPGWEQEYFGVPPVHTHGTMGEIEQAVPLDDGRYQIVLDGVVRFRIVEPMTSDPYRVARVVADPERMPPPSEAWALREWLADLSRSYLDLLPGEDDVPEIGSAALDALTTALIMSLNLAPEIRQDLLSLDDVTIRSERIGKLLQEKIESMKFLSTFKRPADPSSN
ncbi:MAG: LON peptidase substrate-binding domain-containing protein [Thermoanaerobaculia bacterium]